MDIRTDPALKTLDEIRAADEPLAGAKAYNCARLKQAGFRVPDGLVVLANAADGDLGSIAADPWFDAFPPHVRFAVRSSGIGEDSAGQSFAGIHQTTLDVRREDIGRAVAACRASGRSEQALEYRRAKGIPLDAIQMGVLVQRMIQPVAAGVAFTVNPVTGADNEIVINASWGIGEAVVSGQVDPDEFVVDKRTGEPLWNRIGETSAADRATLASLSAEQVRALAAMLLDIERHYGAPQDVEWCHDGVDFWIVQSRPVTTGGTATSGIEWTRANVAEVLPDVTSPQALFTFEAMLNDAERHYMGSLMAREGHLGPMVKSFGGRLYFNLSQLRHICAIGGVAPALMLRSLGHADTIRPVDEQPAPAAVRDRLAALPQLLRLAWRHLHAARIVADHERSMRDYLERLAKVDPRSLSDRDVWSALDEWLRDAPTHMEAVLMLGGVLFHEAPVRRICERVGFPFEHLVYPQLATGERSVSAQQAFDLTRLAERAREEPAVLAYFRSAASDLSRVRTALHGTRFLEDLERFLRTYGHRGRYESDWSLPRYNEDPAPLLRAIRAHLETSADRPVGAAAAVIEQRQHRESAEAWSVFEERLSVWHRATALPRIRKAVRRIKQYYVWRERVRSDMIRVLSEIRAWHLVLADRFVERSWLDRREDYFLIRLPEIASVIEGRSAPDTLRPLAASRAIETERNRSMQMPLLMRESELAGLIRTASVSSRSSDETQLTGHPVSAGCVEAEVVVVRDPGDFGRMKRGAILVAPATDPSWTPLFTLASGVIVEVGGVLSHASTIAREYGLPALANVKHATRRLRSGERIRLDATNGVIHRLSPVTSGAKQG